MLYARFWTRALQRIGMIDVAEPFAGLFTQGMVTHETYRAADGRWLSPDEVEKRDGALDRERRPAQPVETGRVEKMSKSKQNTVDPEPIVDQYGADAVRWFMLSDSPPERDLEWSEAGIEGAWRFVQRLWRLASTDAGAATARTRRSTASSTRRSPRSARISRRSPFNKAVAQDLRADQRDREGAALGRRADAAVETHGPAGRADGAAPRRGGLGGGSAATG